MSFHLPPRRHACEALGLEIMAAEALRLAGVIDTDPFAGVTTTVDRRERLRPIFAARASDFFPPDYRLTYAEVWHAVYGEELAAFDARAELPRSSSVQPPPGRAASRPINRNLTRRLRR
jgi:hypothetical protein